MSTCPSRLPWARALLALALTARVLATQQPVTPDDVIDSLRRMLRDKDTALRASRSAATAAAAAGAISTRRRLGAGTSELCGHGSCMVDLTTGIAGWIGAAATPRSFHWAQPERGAWIGDSGNAAPRFLYELACSNADVHTS